MSSMEKPKINKMSVQELEREIKRHNALYFQENRPVISDYDFDRMVERLKKLKPDAPVLAEIGSDLSKKSKKIEHSSPMLSLDKCYSLEELMRWAGKFEGKVTVSPKIDGAAIAIRYDDQGRIAVAETRGNGFKGDEITPNVGQVGDVPEKLKEGDLEIRGEVYMKLSRFKKYQEAFANPRNLAAGALKQKDPKKTKEYRLNFFAYDLLGKSFKEEQEKFKFLKKLGFIPVPTQVKKVEEQVLERAYQELMAERSNLDYEVDGVVYRVNDIAEQTRLGASAHHPRWAIAYKFQGDSGSTTLKDVEWSVSRTGTISPIGIVEPVTLSGAKVSRVSLHNIGIIKKLGVTLGAEVTLVRSGGVIPKLEAVLKSTKKKITVPKKCPSCGYATEIKGDFLHCTNPKGCRKTKLGELKHFVDVLEIDGFGDKLIEQLYDAGYVEEVYDFYALSVDDLLNLERVGEILAGKLIGNIQDHKKIPLPLFLRSLGIPELGKHASQVLVKNYRNLENIQKVSKEELAEIHTIGDIIAEHVVQGLKEKKPVIQKLLGHIKLEEKASALAGKLSGKSFLFTGKMAAMTRGEAEKKVESNGGELGASVNRDLDYLVIGSEGYRNQDKGSKWVKAEALIQKGADLKIISEEDFLKMLGE